MNLMQERCEIIHGLMFFWNCAACRRLGWDKEHECPKNNQDCGVYLYNKLGTHFVAIHNAKKKAKK